MQYRYEMSLTRADFLRLLPVAVGHAAWRMEGDDIAGIGVQPAWRIRLEERPGRPFGPVELPVLAVTLDLDGASGDHCAAFVERFLLGFQRAGG
ncbi:MAG TPA: hypothetical protein VFV55_09940 [Usitatibacteraceae bacterium]|nr:hypothetical protein [Usitatibacteraceae bacterium]